jgi:hypothetical protein
MEQQDREQEVVGQAFHLGPDRAVQGGVAAHQKAAQDQREIRKKELREVHVLENTSHACRTRPVGHG